MAVQSMKSAPCFYAGHAANPFLSASRLASSQSLYNSKVILISGQAIAADHAAR